MGNVHLKDAVGHAEMLLDGGDGHDPRMRILQMKARLFRGDGARLEQDDAGDDLKAVGDAMLHFVEQQWLLLQQFLGAAQELCLLPLDRPGHGDIPKGQEGS